MGSADGRIGFPEPTARYGPFNSYSAFPCAGRDRIASATSERGDAYLRLRLAGACGPRAKRRGAAGSGSAPPTVGVGGVFHWLLAIGLPCRRPEGQFAVYAALRLALYRLLCHSGLLG